MKALKLTRERKGGVLAEFAMASLLFVTVLLGSLEWSLEIYVRHAVERAASVAPAIYATSRSLDDAQAAIDDQTGHILSRCMQPIDVRLYNSISDVNLADPATGYAPTGTAADDSAVFARLELTCVWTRFTPIMAGILGNEMNYRVITFARMR
jgi:Flp pilus assembly protein TadG